MPCLAPAPGAGSVWRTPRRSSTSSAAVTRINGAWNHTPWIGDSTGGGLALQLDVVLDSRFLDEAELCFEPVDMFLLGQQDVT